MKCAPLCLSLFAAVLLQPLQARAGLERDIPAGSEPFSVFHTLPQPPPEDAVRYVDAASTEPGDGSQARPWRHIQEALRQLRPGQLAYVAGGVYEENLLWDQAVDGTEEAPIVLRALPGTRPVLRNRGKRPLLEVTKSYWIIDGFNLDGAGVRSPQVRFTGDGAHHVLLRRGSLVGAGGGAALFVGKGAHHIQVDHTSLSGTSNWSDLREDAVCQTTADCAAYEPTPAVGLVCVTGGRCATRQDGHGVSIYPDTHHVLLTSNFFWNNSGDGVQCVGPAYAEPGVGTRRPHDVLMQGNTFTNSPSFDGNTENAVDIKDCDRVTLSGGRMQHFRPTRNVRGNSSQGEAILIHFDAQGVLVEGLDLSDACRAVGLGRSVEGEQLANVVIRRNVFHDPPPRSARCASDGVWMTQVKGVDLYHNTFDGFEGAAVSVGEDVARPAVIDVDIWNNIFKGDRGYYLGAHRAGVVGLESGYNLFASDTGKQLRCNFNPVYLEGWSACPGFDPPLDSGGTSRVGEPLFSSPARDTEPGSPARDMALDDGDGAAYCGDGPDVGARESCSTGPQSPTILPPSAAWGLQQGTPEDDLFAAIAVGSEGELFYAGASRGAFSDVPQGGWDATLGRVSADGHPGWSRALGGPGDEQAWALAVDARGQVFMAGATTSDLWEPLAGESDGFIAKFTPDGERLWVRQFGSEGMDVFYGLATDGASVYAAGTTTGSFPGQPHHPSPGGDALLVKADADGNTVWTRVWGIHKNEVLKAVAYAQDSVYVLGEVTNQYLFVTKLTADGTLLWQRQYTLNRAQGTALATDAAGHVYALGAFVPATNRFTPWLLKLDSTGHEVWTRTTFAESAVAFAGMACDAQGGVLMAGRDSHNRGLWKVSPDGALSWLADHPGNSDLTSLTRAVAVDARGGVFLAGETGSSLFAPLQGGLDAWLVKYPAPQP
ncbi:right-handed parallel beta-helix repeat-containing protein [Corallococcus sp. Z5C101001]|uniref:right-handed parallel beta-helix repeat-containing protein n=1 Tax=Corallococcus sp. Z5C101001 TaxID=2596829 RepID=UPI00117FF7DB|nr:right-handed parallel beta-helix repeat-containing protein [Corallococcus sp. Z5C101001]TSC33738.1 hypothetical protein FOF48_01415 [Corallococcus sp. Z5C101001]